MKAYAPYLLYQTSRFGALSIPQMLMVCQGMCKTSSLYRAVKILVDDKLMHLMVNGATRTRAYHATANGREMVLGTRKGMAASLRAVELDHTVDVASVLLELCHHENVAGIATPFEMSLEEVRRFCHERIPDGIVRVKKGDRYFEYAVEVERTKRNYSRVNEVLDRYLQTFRRGMECVGLLIVTLDPEITARYRQALEKMPEEFRTRVRLLEGIGLAGLNLDAFGPRAQSQLSTLEFSRKSCPEGPQYSSVKSGILLAGTPFRGPIPPVGRHPKETENKL